MSLIDRITGAITPIEQLALFENLLRQYTKDVPQKAELSADLFGIRRMYQDKSGNARVADRKVIGTINREETMERFREFYDSSHPNERDTKWLIDTFGDCLTYNFTDRRGITIQFMPNMHQRSFDLNPMCTECCDYADLSPFEDDFEDVCGMCVSRETQDETPQE